jgi:hypothetical protein
MKLILEWSYDFFGVMDVRLLGTSFFATLFGADLERSNYVGKLFFF